MAVAITFKRDTSGVNYAKRNYCNHIFVDMTTGTIWQWSSNKFTRENIKDLHGYPHLQNCVAMSVKEYEEMCDKIESKQYDTAGN